MSIFLSTANPFWDPNILQLFSGIEAQLGGAAFVGAAKNIAAILSIIYLSVRAYSMIIGEGSLQIMELFRPFVIILVILNFSTFATIVASIGKGTENSIRAKFEGNAKTNDALLTKREELTSTLINQVETNKQKMIDKRVIAERIKRQDQGAGGSGILGGIEEGINDFGNAMLQSLVIEAQIGWARLSLFIQELITNFVLSCFKGIAYCMFFIQLILKHIMLVLGPISIAMSIAGPFKNSWVEWTKRYIAISFYATITFMVLNISLAIVQYGFEQEISRLNFILESVNVEEEFIAKVTNMGSYLGLLIIALLTTVGGIMQIPAVAGWIVGGDAGGQVMFQTAAGTAKSVARGGANTGRAVVGAATGGAATVAGAAGSAIQRGATAVGKSAAQSASTIGKSVNTMMKS